MCGIAGMWGPSSRPDAVGRMSSALQHRGPDGAGLWTDRQLTLGHRRLAIVDLSPAGAQPMVSHSGRLALCFNGEVYNHQSLRRELAVPWRGTSDSEVMLEAIEAHGLAGAVRRFVGMFAFAVWDTAEGALHLVRDRLGVKPLYWTRLPDGTLAFASELGALLVLPQLRRQVDRLALAGYLERGCVPQPRSIFEGVQQVPPGCTLRFTHPKQAPTVERYWDLSQVVRHGQAQPLVSSEAQAVELLDGALREAVKLRMEADVPLGAFLSGGIDSSTVVALMQAQTPRPVHTFSIGNESAQYDEGKVAEQVARHLGCEHTAFTVTAQEALEVIPRLPAMYGEPFADASQVPTYLVSRLARREVTVALSGDGGDEVFGGYNRHVEGPRMWTALSLVPPAWRGELARRLASVPVERWDALFAALPRLRDVRLPGLKVHKVARALTALTSEAFHDTLAAVWTSEDGVLAGGWQPRERSPNPGLGLAAQMMVRDLTEYLPDDILVKVDRASMAVGLEAREPLLDHRLVELAWALPQHFKVRPGVGKVLLRRVLEQYVPTRLVSAAKMGFAVPLADWLRGPLKPWARALLEDALPRQRLLEPAVVQARWQALQAGQGAWETHLWTVLMLTAWADHHGVSG